MSLTTYLMLALVAAALSAYVMLIQSQNSGEAGVLPPLDVSSGDGGGDGVGSGPPPTCTSMIDEASCIRTPGPAPYGGRCHWRDNACSDGTIIPDIGAYSSPGSRTIYVHSLDRHNGILALSILSERHEFSRTGLNTYWLDTAPEEAMVVTIDWEKEFTYEIVQNGKVIVTRSYTRGA